MSEKKSQRVKNLKKYKATDEAIDSTGSVTEKDYALEWLKKNGQVRK